MLHTEGKSVFIDHCGVCNQPLLWCSHMWCHFSEMLERTACVSCETLALLQYWIIIRHSWQLVAVGCFFSLWTELQLLWIIWFVKNDRWLNQSPQLGYFCVSTASTRKTSKWTPHFTSVILVVDLQLLLKEQGNVAAFVSLGFYCLPWKCLHLVFYCHYTD